MGVEFSDPAKALACMACVLFLFVLVLLSCAKMGLEEAEKSKKRAKRFDGPNAE